ncbi:MAG: YcxB family protein [Lachnospiraceae bacterium]|nr:YcxB family protein [Lachnospiraceae bacterium]
MEPLIENQVEITLPIFTEWRNSGKTADYKKSMRKYSIIMAIVFVGALVLLRILGMAPFMLITEGILLVIVYLWLLFLSPRSRNKGRYKTLCRIAGGTPKRSIRFYEESFTVTTESDEVREYTYDKITEIKETEHLYVMIVDEADIDILLAKDGFIKGDIEQVKKMR